MLPSVNVTGTRDDDGSPGLDNSVTHALDGQWAAAGDAFAQRQGKGDAGNTFQMPGDVRMDAMLACRFGLAGSKAALQLNIDNVPNTKYYTGSRRIVADWIKRGSPRTTKLTPRMDC